MAMTWHPPPHTPHTHTTSLFPPPSAHPPPNLRPLPARPPPPPRPACSAVTPGGASTTLSEALRDLGISGLGGTSSPGGEPAGSGQGSVAQAGLQHMHVRH